MGTGLVEPAIYDGLAGRLEQSVSRLASDSPHRNGRIGRAECRGADLRNGRIQTIRQYGQPVDIGPETPCFSVW